MELVAREGSVSSQNDPNDNDYIYQLVTEIEEAQNNCTAVLSKALNKLIQTLKRHPNFSTFRSTVSIKRDTSDDTFAVLYIVFVLLFFSTFLVIVLIRYLMRQRETYGLEAFYNDYLQKKPPRTVLYDTRGRRLTDPEVWCEVSRIDEIFGSNGKGINNHKDKIRTVRSSSNKRTKTEFH